MSAAKTSPAAHGLHCNYLAEPEQLPEPRDGIT